MPKLNDCGPIFNKFKVEMEFEVDKTEEEIRELILENLIVEDLVIEGLHAEFIVEAEGYWDVESAMYYVTEYPSPMASYTYEELY